MEFGIPVVYPGVGVQKAIENNEKSEMEVKIWALLIQGCIFQNPYSVLLVVREGFNCKWH